MQRSLMLDMARVFAIALVLIAHFGQLLGHASGDFFGIKNFYYVSLGGVGVSLFLLLSGLLVGLTDAHRSPRFLPYMKKKVVRIYPMYLLTVPLSFVGYLLSGLVLDGGLPDVFPNGFWIDTLGSVTGAYAWLGLWGGPYNPPSWFIGLIMAMYLLAVPLIGLFKWSPNVTLQFLFILSVFSRWYVGAEGVFPFDDSVFDDLKGWTYRQFGFMPGRPTDWFPLCRVFEFALGIYLALQVKHNFWFKLDISLLRKPVTFLSDIAFPLFLLHYPFMFLVMMFNDWGMNTSLSISMFLVFIVVMAWCVTQAESLLMKRVYI
ncbi:acyltransferase [Veronia nyctiphanis]|uniref:Acyltransferase n=1 Tax=Veronia nyctiphanis TaxID=1278244 RepID=A0A4Q0YPB7_9GAMM|nr:acyltransferase family protein [Veronia nyctiphanis]RXJ72792.1 acyltransferase [Veronia nyctiphanis]